MSSPSTTASVRNLYFDLTGRVALITGGGTGVGKMMAEGLASKGATVYITGRREDVLDEVAKTKFDGPGSIHGLKMDVTDKSSIENAVRFIDEKEGKLNVLINNAGDSGPFTPWSGDASAPQRKDAAAYGNALFNEHDFAGWEQLFSVNVASVFFVTSAFLGLLDAGAKSGPKTQTSVVINITSAAHRMSLTWGRFPYVTSKAALAHLTQVMASDFAWKGLPIRINAIAPGSFASQLTASFEQLSELVKEKRMAMNAVPLMRPGLTEEMAAAAIYMASSSAEFMNGHELVIDGGLSLVNP